MLTEAYLQPVHVCTHMYAATNKLRGAAKIFTLSETGPQNVDGNFRGY